MYIFVITNRGTWLTHLHEHIVTCLSKHLKFDTAERHTKRVLLSQSSRNLWAVQDDYTSVLDNLHGAKYVFHFM